MKQVITTILIAGSLMLVDVTPAIAHDGARNVYYPSHQFRVQQKRGKSAPAWLKRDESFKWWYKQTPLKRDKHLSWLELYDVYSWERHYRTRYSEREYRRHSDAWYRRHWQSKLHTDARSRYFAPKGSYESDARKRRR